MGRGVMALVLSIAAAALLLPLRVRATTGDSATMEGLRQLIGGSVVQWAGHLAPPSVRELQPGSAVPFTAKPKPKTSSKLRPSVPAPARPPTTRTQSGPSSAPVPTPAPAPVPSAGGLHLDGILLTSEVPTVMINGQVLKIGEWIEGYRVVKIIPQGVYLQRPPDQWFLLTTDQQLGRVEVRQ